MNNGARAVVAILAGTLFGLGLAISKMTDPNKIISFLDVRGNWDPSLILVMISALVVSAIGFRFPRTEKPLFEESFAIPSSSKVDKRLVAGAAVFGVGWGLGGLCPGPAIAALNSGEAFFVVFLLAMLVGGLLVRLVERTSSRA